MYLLKNRKVREVKKTKSLIILFQSNNAYQAGFSSSNEENNSNVEQIKVLTLGSFHFDFPNLDVKKTDNEDLIDVLEPKYQKEIESIVDKLEKFKPTIIVIERRPEHQEKYDSLYTHYLSMN